MRRAIAAAVAAAMLMAAAPGATAAQQLTGCLDQAYEVPGRIWNVNLSSRPWQPCLDGMRQISWRVTPAKGPRGDRGPRGNQGRKGRAGQPGEQGPRGAQGEPGGQGTFHTYSLQSPCQICNEAGATPAAEVSCDPGDVALGGGFITDGIIIASASSGAARPTGWAAPAAVAAEGSNGSQAQVVCHDRPPLRD